MSGFAILLADAKSSINGGVTAACTSACSAVDLNTIFANVANTLTYIIGAVSVIMIIFGGFRYVISRGDSKAVTDAKNTILYSVIGVVVAICAYAIINFVILQI